MSLGSAMGFIKFENSNNSHRNTGVFHQQHNGNSPNRVPGSSDTGFSVRKLSLLPEMWFTHENEEDSNRLLKAGRSKSFSVNTGRRSSDKRFNNKDFLSNDDSSIPVPNIATPVSFSQDFKEITEIVGQIKDEEEDLFDLQQTDNEQQQRNKKLSEKLQNVKNVIFVEQQQDLVENRQEQCNYGSENSLLFVETEEVAASDGVRKRVRTNADDSIGTLPSYRMTSLIESAAFNSATDQIDLKPLTTNDANGTSFSMGKLDGISTTSTNDGIIDSVDLPPLGGRDPHKHLGKPEPALILFFEVLFPFIIAGLGMVFAGLVFDRVQHWAFYQAVPQALILVPALLGLKGNLEMTLASRLSTQSNTGKMDNSEQVYSIVLANIALIETQAIVVTFLATGAAMALSWIPNGQIDWEHGTLLAAAALSTASLASLALSMVMICVILGAKRWNINPDNVATPIAASLGDLTTLTILSMFGNVYLSAYKTQHWLNISAVLFFVFLLPICTMLAAREPSSRQVLRYGWSPIIFSMLISSNGGFVLERAIQKYSTMALYQPIMNGVGGNLAAVAASKLSTFYHRNSVPGTLPCDWTMQRFTSFSRAFFSADEDSRSARVLLMLCVPGHIFFNWVISILHSQSGQYVQGPLFTALYLSAALAQVTILLFISQWLIALMWLWRQNPDNAAIPYLTAMGDLLGTSFLYIAFCTLELLKPEELHNFNNNNNININPEQQQQQHMLMSSTTTQVPI